MADADQTVLVTGATGFVGGRLAHQLLDEGYHVRILARTPQKADSLKQRGADVVEGDLTDEESIRSAMKGADGVFHLAAIYTLGGDEAWMREVNVDGTRRVLDAAKAADVDKIVYCGSDTSLGNTRGDVCDESKTHDGDIRSVYEKTKKETHELVERRIDQGEPIVNAIVSTVYGPGDESPVAELIEHHLAGRAVAYLDAEAGYTFTHVDDVATALRLAYEKGEIGEGYLVSGEPATFREFFAELSAQTGIPEPRFELPDGVVDATLNAIASLSPAIGKSPDEIEEMVRMGRGVTRFFSNQKARDELGWEPRSLQEGLRDTLPDFRRREREHAREAARSSSVPLALLSGFDILLGLSSVLFPKTYMQVVHDDPPEDSHAISLVRRTGTTWLVFAAAQGIASRDPENRPEWLLASGILRLMDVPADSVYRSHSDDLSLIGKIATTVAPVFNALAGGYLTYIGLRGLRSDTAEDSSRHEGTSTN